MKPLSRLAAWFYDYPNFDVTEQEFALLQAVRDGPVPKADLLWKLGVKPDQLQALLDSLRQKRLLGRYRPIRIAPASFWGFSVGSIELSDPGSVWLSEPGRKLLKHRSKGGGLD